MSRLIALYPRDWRARYEDEYLALLADRPNDPRDSLDIGHDRVAVLRAIRQRQQDVERRLGEPTEIGETLAHGTTPFGTERYAVIGRPGRRRRRSARRCRRGRRGRCR